MDDKIGESFGAVQEVIDSISAKTCFHSIHRGLTNCTDLNLRNLNPSNNVLKVIRTALRGFGLNADDSDSYELGGCGCEGTGQKEQKKSTMTMLLWKKLDRRMGRKCS